jgi:predicted nuclease of predicted toxin-antitoxin system
VEFWIDAQISPAIAAWMRYSFNVPAVAVRELGLREAEDPTIFWRARAAGAVVLTKGSDFVTLVQRHGAPPQVVWVRLGNTSNAALRSVLTASWAAIRSALEAGEPLIELRESAV